MREKKSLSVLNKPASMFGVRILDALIVIGIFSLLSIILAGEGWISLVPILVLPLLLPISVLRVTYREGIMGDYIDDLLRLTFIGRELDYGSKDLVEVVEHENGLVYWITNDFRIGTSLKIEGFDVELGDINEIDFKIQRFLNSISKKITITINQKSGYSNSFNAIHSRGDSLSQLVGKELRYDLHLEMDFKISFKNLVQKFFKRSAASEELINRFNKLINLEEISSELIVVRPFSKEEVLREFYEDSEGERQQDVIAEENDFVSLIALTEISDKETQITALNKVLETQPMPLEVIFRATKIDRSKILAKSHWIKRLESESTSLTSQTKTNLADSVAASVEMENQDYFDINLYIKIRRKSAEEAREVKRQILSNLSGLEKFEGLSIGLRKNLKSSKPGHKQHLALTDSLLNVVSYIPLMNSSKAEIERVSPHSFFYQRKNLAWDHFLVNDDNYDHYSGIIIGKAGSGKSTLLNSLIRCFHNNENFSQVIVDVKGSHRRLVNNLGGKIVEFGADSAPSDNPFKILKVDRSSETIELLVGFLESLVSSDDEPKMSLDERGELERCFLEYIDNPKNPLNLASFIKNTNSLPRKGAYSRWGEKGSLSHVFSSQSSEKLEVDFKEKLIYYNFSSLSQASNTELSKAIMGLIMLNFHMRLKTKPIGEFTKFINDEVAFFTEHFFSQFKFLSRNLRKLNGGVLLTSQDLSSLIVNDDPFLITHTDYKFLFETGGLNGEPERRSLNFNDELIQRITHLKSIKGKYSNFLLVDPLGTREGFLRLTAKEYYQSTTKAEDNQRLEKIMTELNLSEDSAVELENVLFTLSGRSSYAN